MAQQLQHIFTTNTIQRLNMEVAIGIIVYIALLIGLMLFGRFLHQCDEVLERQYKKQST